VQKRTLPSLFVGADTLAGREHDGQGVGLSGFGGFVVITDACAKWIHQLREAKGTGHPARWGFSSAGARIGFGASSD
jgi:hypothetical protein